MGACCGGGSCGAALANEARTRQPPATDIINRRAPWRPSALIRIFLIRPHYADLMIAEKMVGPGNFVLGHVAAGAIGLAGRTCRGGRAMTGGAFRIVRGGLRLELLVRVVAADATDPAIGYVVALAVREPVN